MQSWSDLFQGNFISVMEQLPNQVRMELGSGKFPWDCNFFFIILTFNGWIVLVDHTKKVRRTFFTQELKFWLELSDFRYETITTKQESSWPQVIDSRNYDYQREKSVWRGLKKI